MRLLIDTHLLLWAGHDVERLSHEAAALIGNPLHQPLFSSLAVAEIAIKHAQGRKDFPFQSAQVRAALLASAFEELPLTGRHATRLADLPPIHKDPFDRLMVAQALAEGIAFVTADAVLAQYPGQIMVV